MAKISEAMKAALKLLASSGGSIDCYDPRADRFSDDGDPDTWNMLFNAKLARQSYDTSDDTGHLELLPDGRALLDKE